MPGHSGSCMGPIIIRLCVGSKPTSMPQVILPTLFLPCTQMKNWASSKHPENIKQTHLCASRGPLTIQKVTLCNLAQMHRKERWVLLSWALVLTLPRALTLSASCFKFHCVIDLTHRVSNCSRVSANFMSHAGWTKLSKKIDFDL